MSKLLAALIAVGFSVGLNGAIAQNVDSDKDKAQGQEKVMKEKEQGASGAGQTEQIKKQSGQSDQTGAKDKPDQSDAARAKPDATGPDTGKMDTDKKKYDK